MIDTTGPENVRVTFERVRNNRNIPDLEIHSAGSRNLERMIREHVMPYMTYPGFVLHIENGSGWIDAGVYNAGNFSIIPIDETPLNAAAEEFLEEAARLNTAEEQLVGAIRSAVNKGHDPEWVADQTGLPVRAIDQALDEGRLR